MNIENKIETLKKMIEENQKRVFESVGTEDFDVYFNITKILLRDLDELKQA